MLGGGHTHLGRLDEQIAALEDVSVGDAGQELATPASLGGLLERGAPLEALETSWVDAVDGRGRLVLVTGEAGIGKTAMVREFCDRQRPQRRVLWGACDGLRTPRPFAPFVDVAAGAGDRFAETIARGERPARCFAALIDELAAAAPTILVVEDLHWADEATLDVMTMLGRRAEIVPALVVATYRDDELATDHPLRSVLGQLRIGNGVRRLSLSPLSLEAVEALAAPAGADAADVYRVTGGNPFFVTEVLATVGQRVPPTVRDAVLARAGRLSRAARRLLEATSVVPGRVDLRLLEAVAPELVDRLEECVASGMLTPGQADIGFRHELARVAIEESIPPDRRARLHRAVLAALEDRQGDSPDCAGLADHAEAAGDREAVIRWAPQAAGEAARKGSHREAAAQYARALRFARGLALETRAELLKRRVDECWMTDQFAAAIEAQEEALECRRQLGDQLGEGDALRTLSRLMFFVGRVREGEALALEAVGLLEQLPPGHELAMAYGNVSQRRMVAEDLDTAIATGGRALDLAQRFDDTEATVYALTNIGAAEFQADLEEGLGKLQRALTLALEHDLEDSAERAFFSIAHRAVAQRRFDLADAYLGPGLEYCRERGLDTWRLYLLGSRARMELHRGRWDQAAESAALVLRDPRSAPVARGVALTTLGSVRARRGDPEAAAPLSEEQRLAWPTDELSLRIAPVAAARAEAAWLAGDTAAVGQETDAALSLALRRRAPWWAGELACWRRRAGMRDRLPPGAVAEPYALSLAGESEQAAKSWQELGCPYEAAMALADADAEEPLRRAHDELQALGGRPAAAIVARKLRERGVRGVPRGPRPRTRANPAGLTTRELEVLALLAKGRRNAAIAGELVVSEKTVDHHVSAILRKLDVRTRGEAAAEAARLGLAAPR
jgi:DNA-binding CsgD family transcriptional regulator/tetratricopeptide (TPR) repeat protein